MFMTFKNQNSPVLTTVRVNCFFGKKLQYREHYGHVGEHCVKDIC